MCSSDLMRRTIDETERRRAKQMAYNEEHGITPSTVRKSTQDVMAQTSVLEIKNYDPDHPYAQEITGSQAAEESYSYIESVESMTESEMEKQIRWLRKRIEKAAKDMDFMEAAKLRDDLLALQNLLEKKKK